MATRGTKSAEQIAKHVIKRRGLVLLLGGSSTLTFLLILLLVIAAIFGAVAIFSGDEEGTGATSESAQSVCPGAGTAGNPNVSDLAGDVTVGALSAAATRNASTIIQVAWAKGLGDDGAVIGVIVGMAEAGLQNYANDGTSTLNDAFLHRQLTEQERATARQSMQYPHDAVGRNLDSIGLFQQRPMTGWGDPADLVNPATSSGKFFDALTGQVPNWRNLNPWNAAQTVQGSPSSNGGIYREKYPEAQAVVDELKKLIPSGSSTTGAVPSPTVNTATPATRTSASASAPTVLAAAPPTGSAATGNCRGNAGGGVGAPVVFNGSITITAPSGTYTVKLPDGPRGKFLESVATKMGTSYVWGAAGPDVFDCSGLMSWGLTQAGVGVGRLTADDFWQTFPKITSGAEQPGDLVLFGARYGTSGNAGHIGVVIDPAQHLMMHTYTDTAPATISRYDTWDLTNGGPLGFVQAVPDGATATTTTTAAAPGVLIAAR